MATKKGTKLAQFQTRRTLKQAPSLEGDMRRRSVGRRNASTKQGACSTTNDANETPSVKQLIDRETSRIDQQALEALLAREKKNDKEDSFRVNMYGFLRIIYMNIAQPPSFTPHPALTASG